MAFKNGNFARTPKKIPLVSLCFDALGPGAEAGGAQTEWMVGRDKA